MGNAFTACADTPRLGDEVTVGQQESSILAKVEEQAEEAVAAAKKVAVEAIEKVDDVADAVVEQADGKGSEAKSGVDQVAEIAENAAEAVEETVEKAAETVEKAAETVETTTEGVQKAADQAIDAVKDAAKDTAEAVSGTMDAAMACVTCTMIVEFVDKKGCSQKLDFKTQKLGLTPGISGGCCAPKANSKVVAKKADKGGQAEKLGLKSGWQIRSINGTEVTGLGQAKQLLESCSAKLPKE